MGTELQIPDSFKGRSMPQAFVAAGLDAQDDNLAEGIGQSYGVIQYKGKVWTLRHRGERHMFIDPKTGTQLPYLDVIILGQAKVKSKSYYGAYTPGQSDGERPICSSMDGLVPDPDIQPPQASHCSICPRNEWKKQANGRQGRECTDYKRLAVLILPTLTAPILGTPLVEPVFLRVPPDSLNSLAVMGETMGSQGHHYSSYITRITFDPQKAHPAMVFRPIQGLSEQEAPVIIELTQNSLVGRITGNDQKIKQAAAPITLQAPGTAVTGLTAGVSPTGQNGTPSGMPTQPTPPPTPASSVAATQTVQQPSVSAGLVAAPPVTPTPSTVTPSNGVQHPSNVAPTESGLVSTGLGGVNTVSDAPPAQPAGQTAVDAGDPEDADAALDARIAKMLQRA